MDAFLVERDRTIGSLCETLLPNRLGVEITEPRSIDAMLISSTLGLCCIFKFLDAFLALIVRVGLVQAWTAQGAILPACVTSGLNKAAGLGLGCLSCRNAKSGKES